MMAALISSPLLLSCVRHSFTFAIHKRNHLPITDLCPEWGLDSQSLHHPWSQDMCWTHEPDLQWVINATILVHFSTWWRVECCQFHWNLNFVASAKNAVNSFNSVNLCLAYYTTNARQINTSSKANLFSTIKRCKLSWLGHVCRHDVLL